MSTSKLGPSFVKTGDEMRCQDDNNTQEPKKKRRNQNKAEDEASFLT
jgi:hypothetical protein